MFFRILFLWTICVSCNPPPATSSSGRDAEASLANASADQNAAQKKTLKGPQDKVYMTDLHSYLYEVKSVSISWQVYSSGKNVVLSYVFPSLANYLEILRCKKTAVLDFAKPLNEVQGHSQADRHEDMLEVDYWLLALESKQCVVVHYGFDTEHKRVYEDKGAPSGDYYYILRACVDIKRIQDRAMSFMNSCSRFVSRSADVNLVNHQEWSFGENLENVADLRSEMKAEFHRMQGLAQKALDAYKACDDKEAERQKRLQRRRALINIISLGLSAVMSWGMGGGWKESMEQSSYLAPSLAAVLMDFTSRPEDFGRGCYDGVRHYEHLSVSIRRFQELMAKYSQAVSDL